MNDYFRDQIGYLVIWKKKKNAFQICDLRSDLLYITKPSGTPLSRSNLIHYPSPILLLKPRSFFRIYRRRRRRMSSSTQQQFRYTQTPSKVLHLRNLPWECTDDELVHLCSPFGKIVNTKCNVGANRNQAFVEFVTSLSLSFLFFLFSILNFRLFRLEICYFIIYNFT